MEMGAYHSPSWATGALSGNPAEVLKAFEESFAVHLIATPRNAFRTCAPNEHLASVVERNRPDQFDFLPVTELITGGNDKPNHIIGLVELVPFMDQTVDPAALICQHMRFLSEENLIGADAGILDFVRDADQRRCRLVVSGSEISGLVSLSDLQRLPVRAALFSMVTHLEMLMAELIRHDPAQTNVWRERLCVDRRNKILSEVSRSRKGDSFVDELLFTQFADKITIIKKSALASSNKDKFEKDLKRTQALRDALAHANEYAASRDDAGKVCETVRIMDKWIDQFSRWLSAFKDAPHTTVAIRAEGQHQ